MSLTRALLWGLLLPLLLAFFNFAIAENCIRPKAFPHYVSVDMQEVDTNICHKCFVAPGGQVLQVVLHELRLGGLGSVLMYVDSSPRSFTKDCGGDCETENFIEVNKEGLLNTKAEARCSECDSVPNGTLIEVYIRLNTKVKAQSVGENLCQNLSSIIPTFNLSLNINTKKRDLETPLGCDDGFSVNFPVSGDTCIVNATFTAAKTRCVIPTCSDGVILPDLSIEKLEHKFLPFTPTEACVWQLNTEQRKHLTLRFSENIRPHLTVFEETLLNPKWDVEWCPSFSNEFEIETDATSVFIVYHNAQELSKKGTLTMSTKTDLCILPPKLENGNVEFKHLGSGMVAFYSCLKGYAMLGPSELRCKNRSWDKPPICLPLDKPDLNLDDTEETDYIEEGQDFEEEDVTNMPSFDYDEMFTSNKTDLEGMDGEDIIDIPMLNVSFPSGEVIASANRSEDGLKLLRELFNLTMEDDMTLYLIIGAVSLGVLMIIIIITLIIYRKKYPVRLGLGRKFDTFQNPIYEKTVVQMPMQIEETDVGRKKSDAEEMSDCTVLE